MENFYNLDFKAIEFDGFKMKFLNEGFSKSQSIEKLNKIAISRMKILSGDRKELYDMYSKNKEN